MELINNIEQEIRKLYNEKGIICLGMNQDYTLPNGKQLLVWNAEIISNVIQYGRINSLSLNSNDFSFHQVLDNILFISREIGYFTAHCFLYVDKINNIVKDKQTIFDSKKQEWIEYYPNYGNLESSRYDMYLNVVFEKLYNFWDKLGDLLWATFFQSDMPERRVDFHKTIDLISTKYPEYKYFKSFIWLENFKDNDYKNFNEIRKDIVHYSSLSIKFKYQHLGTEAINKSAIPLNDKSSAEQFMNERKSYCDLFLKEIHNSIEGYIKTHELIEEILNYRKQNP